MARSDPSEEKEMEIWKFPLEIRNRQTIEIPGNPTFLSLQIQRGIPTLWAAVKPENPTVQIGIHCFSTGHSTEDSLAPKRFLGTVQTEGGGLVWHYFSDWHCFSE